MATQNTFVLEVDFTGDADFADANENITAYTLAFSCTRGRDNASQLTGRSVAGRLQATLDNRDGRFSSFNASSPIYGSVLPGRKIRLRSTAPTAATLWAGFLDRIEPSAGAMPIATLYAGGPFVKLAGPNARVNPAAQADVYTGDIIDAILDAAGWPAPARDIDIGNIPVTRWYAEESEALALMQEIEDTEQGFLSEGLAWDVVFEARYNRFLNHLTSVATLSDAAAATLPYLLSIQQSDPLREIFNSFEATIQPYVPGTTSVLWALQGEVPTLLAGESRTYIGQVSSFGGASVAYAESWTTPVVGTDIIQSGVANGDIAVSVVSRAKGIDITLTNNHATAAATITLLQARGVPVFAGNPFKISDSDATSQTKYGLRNYPLASPWYPNAAYAASSGAYVIARYKDQRPILELPISPSSDDLLFAQAVNRNLSDRITVVAQGLLTELGINNEFYIESIAHAWQAPGPLETVFGLSPAEADPNWFILDASLLNGADALAY